MTIIKIISVVGVRPNFIKIAPFIWAINNYNRSHPGSIHHILVHSGQHYDQQMSDIFFSELNIPPADINLEIGSGSPAEQVGQTMIAFEKVLKTEKPNWVVVVGDVNCTLACSITAKKERIKCCHIEAGLRSGDFSMPEEVNRIVADRLSDLLLVPDKISLANLRKEGVPEKKNVLVGNIMIDTLEENRGKASIIQIDHIIASNKLSSEKKVPNIENGKYAILTIHRASNVDEKKILAPIVEFIEKEVASAMPVIWPVHPRTLICLENFGLLRTIKMVDNLVLLQPLSYLHMLRLNMDARIMLTDSGGLQEESTVLGTPCLTLRWSTERPITLVEYGGQNMLVGNDIVSIRQGFLKAIKRPRKVTRPDLWDGHTAERCLDEILKYPHNSEE